MASEKSAIETAYTAHASLVAPSWAILFPLGAILIRVAPSSKAWVIHAAVMLFALSTFTSGAAVAIWRTLKDGYKISNEAHTLFGVIIFALVWTQPITGLFNHYFLKHHNYRTIVSTLHVFLGRLLITAGMINGGLGLLLGMASTRAENIAYGVIVGTVWVAYLLTSFYYEAKRSNKGHRAILALAQSESKSPRMRKSDELE